MFAISYDIEATQAQQEQVRGVLTQHGFYCLQGNVYVADSDDLVTLFDVINELKSLPWLAEAARSIKAFRMENMSDFTELIKEK